MKTKAQMNWEIGKEREENLVEELKETIKQIRTTEYRRGKEDGIKEASN